MAQCQSSSSKRSGPWGLILVVILGLLGLGTGAAAQIDDAAYDFRMTTELKPFWDSYWQAKLDGDRDAIDKIVRSHREDANDALDLLLDDLCQKDIQALHHEVRTLAWTLDEITRSERYITRVRLVLELEMRDRVRRYRARQQWFDAIDLENVAKENRTVEAWQAAMSAYLAAYEEFSELGDIESSVYCLSRCEQIEYQRQRPWERSRFLQQIVQLGSQLTYRESVVSEADQALQALISEGVDPDKDKPAELGEKEAADPAAGGRGLSSFAEGANEETFDLKLKVAKKGLVGVALPTIFPAEQYQLWPRTYIAGNGPADFDMQRSTFLNPWGQRWILGRSGIQEFTLDTNGDGEVDFTFSPSTTPKLFEVPGPEGEAPYPIMFAILADREKMFGIETNYSPTQAGARLRFYLAGSMEGKVLGQPWKLYDLNMDGRFGGGVENWDDLVTVFHSDDSVNYWEPDGVLIGRAKKAIPLSSVLPVGDDFYRCTPAADGSSLKLRKMNLATGKVKLDLDFAVQPDFVLIRETEGKLEGAYFDVMPAKRGGEVAVPAGKYTLCLGAINNGKRLSMDQVRMYAGTSAEFTVFAGSTTTLELGAPYTMTFKTTSRDKERLIDTTSIRVFGRGGEEYGMFFDDPLQPDVNVQTSDGRKIVKGDSMRRTGLEEWQNKNNSRDSVLWFPAEYGIEVPKGQTYQFQLTQKKHSLLGGPLESDWIQ